MNAEATVRTTEPTKRELVEVLVALAADAMYYLADDGPAVSTCGMRRNERIFALLGIDKPMVTLEEWSAAVSALLARLEEPCKWTPTTLMYWDGPYDGYKAGCNPVHGFKAEIVDGAEWTVCPYCAHPLVIEEPPQGREETRG